MALENLHHLGGHAINRFALPLGELPDKVIDQEGNVVLPFAQRWKRNRKDIQPIVKIRAKFSLLDHGPEVPVGCGNDAHIDRNGATAAEALDLPLLQPPYSLLARDAEEQILPFALKHDIGVIVYSPMASGLLSGAMTRERIVALPEGDWRKRSKNFLEPALSHSLVLVETLREFGRRHNATPGALAIAWTLRNPAVTGAIVGIRKPQQVDGTVIATDIRLSTSEAIAIEQVLSLQPA